MKRYPIFILAVVLALSLSGCSAVLDEQTQATAAETAVGLGEKNELTGAWDAMNCADFWIALDENADRIRMTEEEKDAFQASLAGREGTGVVDLDALPDSFGKYDLKQMMTGYGDRPDSNYYTGSSQITAKEVAAIYENMAVESMPDKTAVQYGFVSEAALLRIFPSDLPLYEAKNDIEFDKGVETRLKIWEPVAILHPSADGEWYFVRTYNSVGWLKNEQIALCEKTEWQRLRTQLEDHFVLVTAANVVLDGSAYTPNASQAILEMGTKLPLLSSGQDVDHAVSDNCFTAYFPQRDREGCLVYASVRIPKGEDVHEGYLPYTGENLLRQAFKLLGHRYGWGGMFGGWDCSSLVQDIYQTVGIYLPRNAMPQAKTANSVYVAHKSEEEKTALLKEAGPGALVTMNGHQTVYLGEYEGEAFLIHSTYGVYAPDGTGRFYQANSTIVSSGLARRGNGDTILTNCHTITKILPS